MFENSGIKFIKTAKDFIMKQNARVLFTCKEVFRIAKEHVLTFGDDSILIKGPSRKKFAQAIKEVLDEEKNFLKSVPDTAVWPLKTCKNSVVLERLLTPDQENLSPMVEQYLDLLKFNISWDIITVSYEHELNSHPIDDVSLKENTSLYLKGKSYLCYANIPMMFESQPIMPSDPSYLVHARFGTGWARTFEMINLLLLSWSFKTKTLKKIIDLDPSISQFTHKHLLGSWQTPPKSGYFSSKDGHYYIKGQYEYGGNHPEVWRQLKIKSLTDFKNQVPFNLTSFDCSSFVAYVFNIIPVSTKVLMDQYKPEQLIEKDRVLPILHLTRNLEGSDYDGYSIKYTNIKQGDWIVLRRNTEDQRFHQYTHYPLLLGIVFSGLSQLIGHQEMNNHYQALKVMVLSMGIVLFIKFTKILDRFFDSINSAYQLPNFQRVDLDYARPGDLAVKRGHVVIIDKENNYFREVQENENKLTRKKIKDIATYLNVLNKK